MWRAYAEVVADTVGSVGVHSVHLWTLTSVMEVASAHLMSPSTPTPTLYWTRRAPCWGAVYGFDHATLQVVPEDHEGCAELNW